MLVASGVALCDRGDLEVGVSHAVPRSAECWVLSGENAVFERIPQCWAVLLKGAGRKWRFWADSPVLSELPVLRKTSEGRGGAEKMAAR